VSSLESTATSGLQPASFLVAPDDDLEHQRILAAAGAALFGLPPLRIAHYRIIRQIGVGGMGEVFLAHDEILDRAVALKLLRREFGRARTVAPLEFEARALARLSHPNVVQVHELGRHGDRAYLAMEYVEGRTLAAWLAETKPGWRAILAVFDEAGRGLAAAHAIGLVHRDFKPENVLVGSDGRTRVVDFGLARLDAELGAAARAGTPRYMAPEQLAGGLVDPRSDQFGFCVTLAEALWGVALREPSSPPPPGVVPRWLWRVVRRGLQADPSRRWPDMPSLLRALDPRPRRRQQIALVLGLAGLVASFMLPASEPDPCMKVERELDSSWSSTRAERLRSAAATRAEDERAAVEQLSSVLDEWAGSWRTARVRTCRAQQEGSDVALREACLARQRLKIAALVDAAIDHPEQLSAHVRELTDALPSPEGCELDAALQSGIELPDPAIADEVERLRAIAERAAAARLLGRAEASLPGLAEAIVQAEQIGHPPVLAQLQAELGSAELLAGSRDRGIEWLERAAQTAWLAHDDRLAAGLWLELSWHAVEQGRVERGRQWFERASDAWTRVGIDAHVQAKLDFAAGILALGEGELDAAQRSLDAALVGGEPGLRPFVLERLADLAERRGQVDRVIDLREQARDAASEHFGAEHPRTAQQRYRLALALFAVDGATQAESELAHAIASWQRAHVRPHEDLADAHALLAAFALEHGRLDEALFHAERSRTVIAEIVEGHDAALAYAWNTLGMVRHARGELAAAAGAFGHAHAIFEVALGPTHSTTLETASNHGASLLALGRLDDAELRFARVLAPAPEWASIVAGLGLAEIDLRRGRPEAARAKLDTFSPEEPIDRLEHALLLALADLRLGRDPDRAALDRIIAEVGETGRPLIDRHVANLAIGEAEAEQLGL
jgi:serine/threonine protein kinase